MPWPSACVLLLLASQAAAVGAPAEGGAGLSVVPPELYRELGDMRVAPLLTGMWQVGGGHGYRPEPRKVEVDMRRYAAAGLNTFDRKSEQQSRARLSSAPLTPAPLTAVADHYGSSEDWVGNFWRSAAAKTPHGAPMYYLTKWVPAPKVQHCAVCVFFLP